MQINGKTFVCCAIGNPIEHSLSPAIHNAAFEKAGIDGVFVAFRVEDVGNAVKGFRSLGIRGVSVTIPHKRAVMPFLDEMDETARKIGAVNTIVNTNGVLKGYNTDWIGAIRALEEKLGVEPLKGKKVVLIGAGGASRAVAFGVVEKDAKLTILNRNKEKAEDLAQEINNLTMEQSNNVTFNDLSALSEIQSADIVINATPVGMTPNTNETPFPKEFLQKNQTVFDIVYNPKETRLIKDAKEAGCEIVYGYKMLLHQAVAQFELYTGKDAPVEVMEEALLKALSSRT